MIFYALPCYNLKEIPLIISILKIIKKYFMTKRTLSNKTRYSILKVSGFRARMLTAQGQKTIRNRRRKGRKKLSIQS